MTSAENSREPSTLTGGARNHRPDCQCGFCGRLKANQEMAAAKERRGQKARRRQLTPKQRRWVQEFSSEGSPGFKNATRSAVMAGYSPDSADLLEQSCCVASKCSDRSEGP
jgi:hypothetical protein